MTPEIYLDYVFERIDHILTPDGLVSLHSAVTGKLMLPRLDFSHEIAFELASVPEVEAVFTSQLKDRHQLFFVWAIVPNRDHEVYRKIFKVEQSIIDKRRPIEFDFTIMPSQGKDPRTLVTDPSARLVFIR
jgi:hypothetical protein